MRNDTPMHGTTILAVRHQGSCALAGDGQVTLGQTIVKHKAKKIQRLHGDKVLAGFAGSTADAMALIHRFEARLDEYRGNLQRAAVELAKEWRTERSLRRLEAFLIVADRDATFPLSGAGDVIAPDDGIVAVGSGGTDGTRRRPGPGSAREPRRRGNRSRGDAHRRRDLRLHERCHRGGDPL